MDFVSPPIPRPPAPQPPPRRDDASPSAARRLLASTRRLTPLRLLAGAIILAGLEPLVLPYFRDLGERPPYALYPLLLLAAAVLAVARVRELRGDPFRRGGWAIAGSMLVAALLLLILGTITYVRWLAAPAALLTLAGLVWRLGGRSLARAVAPAGVLLLTIVPPPARGEATLTVWLQHLCVQVGSRLLDILSIPHVRTGNVLALPGHRLLVEEACSGINSIVAMSAFTLLAGFWRRRPAAWVIALLPVGLLFVVAINVVRIVGGAAVLAWTGTNLFEPSVHEWIGLLCFAIGVGLVFSTDAAIDRFVGMRPRNTSATARDHATVASAPWVAAGFALAFAATGAWSAWHLRHCWPAPRLSADAVFHVPAEVAGWTLLPPSAAEASAETTNTTAKHTRHWTFRHAGDGQIAEVAIAFPFTIWFHDPRACYSAGGWSTGPLTPIDSAIASYRFELEQTGGRHAMDYFADFNERGVPQESFVHPSGSWLARNLSLTRRAAFYEPACEVQTLAIGPQPLDDAQAADLHALFVAVRDTLREQTIALTGGPR